MLPDTEVTALSCCNCVFSSSQQTDLHFISAPATKRRKRQRCNCHLQSEDTSCSNPNTYKCNWPDNDPVYHNGTIWKNMVYRNTNTHIVILNGIKCAKIHTRFLNILIRIPFHLSFSSLLCPPQCVFISQILENVLVANILDTPNASRL